MTSGLPPLPSPFSSSLFPSLHFSLHFPNPPSPPPLHPISPLPAQLPCFLGSLCFSSCTVVLFVTTMPTRIEVKVATFRKIWLRGEREGRCGGRGLMVVHWGKVRRGEVGRARARFSFVQVIRPFPFFQTPRFPPPLHRTRLFRLLFLRPPASSFLNPFLIGLLPGWDMLVLGRWLGRWVWGIL